MKGGVYFSEVQILVRVVEGGELSGAAVQVHETRAERRQETETVVDCRDTKRRQSSMEDSVERGTEETFK